MVGPHLDVAVLGPLEVRRDGMPLAVPPGRPSVTLAALAVRGGAIVPVDVLAGYLWSDDEPRHPRGAIQTHIARLRSALGPGVVVAAGDGYRLDLQAASIDHLRFRDLVANGRGADPEVELGRLDAALSLWRGRPLVGLLPDVLEQEAGPLIVEELLAATERRNELRLRFGDVGDEFVPAVRRLVVAHPWRERLWAQLMRALYQQGRRGEALAAYHELVDVLRDQLGIDPGDDLTRLHGRILASDPELLDAPGPARPARTIPVQLPPAAGDFVGRGHEVDALTSALSAEQAWARVGVISGPGGSGKTALALRVGHVLRDAHPDGQLFAELRASGEPAPPGDVLAEFLRALGVDDTAMPSATDERASMFRSACAGRRLLVLLDDAHDAAQLAPLLPGVEGCSVLVTSRPQLGVLPADVRIDLGRLGDDEAHELLATIVGRARAHAEPEAVGSVVESCQGSPLALRIAGGRLASRPSWPIMHLAQQLDGASRLDVLQIGELSVRATLNASVEVLHAEDAGRFRLLAALPGAAADVEAAAVAWQSDVHGARQCLERLVDVRLLDSDAPDRYRWHDLVDDYVRVVVPAEDAGAARRRLVRWYLRSLHNTWPLVRPGSAATESAPWFPHDVDGRGFASRDDVHAWLHPRWALLASLGRDGLGDDDPQVVDEGAALLLALGRSGYECCRDTRIEAVARSVLDAPSTPGDRRLTARAWHGLAMALGDQGRHTEALDAGARGLAVRRALGDRYGEVIMLHNMAVWYDTDRRFDDAAKLFEECANAADVLSPQMRARCRRNLAHVRVSQGRFDEAQRNLERAWGETGDRLDVDVHDHISTTAHLYQRTGRYADAAQAYDRAAELAASIGSAPLRAAALARGARAHRLAGGDGAPKASEALEQARENRLADTQADALVELGHAAVAQGDAARSADHWHAALKLYESLRSAEAHEVRELLSTLKRDMSE